MLLCIGALGCTINSVCYDDHDCDDDHLCLIPLSEPSGKCRLTCEHDLTCPEDEICQPAAGRSSGICGSPCEMARDCPDGNLCEPDTGRCGPAECGDARDCSGGLVCSFEGRCRPDTPPECYDVNECQFEGQQLCVAEVPTKYRTCIYRYDGCLSWDCAS